MTKHTASLSALVAAALVGAALTTPAVAAPSPGPDRPVELDVRFATFNASLNRASEGELTADLSTGEDQQARNVAETIQRAAPDVVLINEFDYDRDNVDLFRDNYLAVGQDGADPVDYPYAYIAPSNTGVPSGFDLNDDGEVGGPDDAYGFGLFPGQYGMVVYSRFPIDTDAVRTFQRFRWTDMPGNLIPSGFYDAQERRALRLSSKSHWDVPIQVGDKTVHLLAAHPTPPTFDGPEDRNGRRNHDEIRFWADYVAGPQHSRYIYDDRGRTGGLEPGERFVIAGDYNADPDDGDSRDGAITQLLDHPRVGTQVVPDSDGAVEAAELQGGANDSHVGDPAHDTADFNDDPEPGNLRVDYVLPSRSLPVRDAGVFWPTSDDPLFDIVGTYPFPTSDHRLVWTDVRLPHRR
ncbi:endonuclease/exonuclease/phosphatase family protein [Serinicoccus chungangensis]|uniref:endonuclease/exonuclease/phosphatase family protein n=1 Tax=Serinicoccus chungangensis TaxID=767452 RepID=UPI0011192697|nr:endonuclease/exonuclease/phosphatase family protein [Serinicoccus chungangensis]